jgi:hypothetical protein
MGSKTERIAVELISIVAGDCYAVMKEGLNLREVSVVILACTIHF